MKSFVLITGASSGIGKATAERLTKEGKNVIINARRKERLEELATALRKSGVEVLVRPCDLTNEKAVNALFDELSTFTIEAVINNAGRALGKDHVEDASFEDIKGMVATNITAFLKVMQRSIPLLKKSKGHLVNIGSIAGLEVYEGGITYCGTKHFVHAANKGVRIELAGTGVRVTEILPGNVATEFSLVRFKGDEERASKVYEGYEALQAADIADAIWYALSRPKHVNIQHMLVMPTAQSSVGKLVKKES